jgi:putative NADH-flavin reductase
MKIAVVAANGKEGKLITQEATNRGLDVTAIVRSANKSVASKVIEKDLFDLTADDLKDFDVVVDAFGTWKPETLHLHSESLAHLCDILSGSKTRLIVVGGAGSLYVDSEHKTRLVETPQFPAEARELSRAQVKAFDELAKRDDVQWTFVSPAINFQPAGPRTGAYKLCGDELTTDADGKSTISYADFAVAIVDEAENARHIHQHISLRYE